MKSLIVWWNLREKLFIWTLSSKETVIQWFLVVKNLTSVISFSVKNKQFLLLLLFIICVWVFSCMCVCALCVCSIHRCEKMALDYLELELWVLVSCHVYAGNFVSLTHLQEQSLLSPTELSCQPLTSSAYEIFPSMAQTLPGSSSLYSDLCVLSYVVGVCLNKARVQERWRVSDKEIPLGTDSPSAVCLLINLWQKS